MMLRDSIVNTAPQMKRYSILKHEPLYQGFYRVDRVHIEHERFDGTSSGPFTREMYERARDVAGILLFDPRQDKVVLVEQFRTCPALHNENPWTLEIVLGMVDVNENPVDTARREAMEEAGCTMTAILPICDYYSSPGGTTERIHLYAGRVNAPDDQSLAGIAAEHEDIRVHVLDAAKAIGLISRNKIRDAQTLVALQWFAMHHTDLRSRWLVSEVGTPII